MFFPGALSAVLLFAQSTPSLPTKDALALLNEVGQRYSAAKSYRIEAISERTSSNDLSRNWQKTILAAIVASGGKYRYEGRSGIGGAILVSDAATEWNYHVNEHLYTERAVLGEDSMKGRVIPFEEAPLVEAKALMVKLVHRADALKSATFLPEQTISVGEKSLNCYVVHYTDDDFRKAPKHKEEATIWIDKQTGLVRKVFTRQESEMMQTAIPMLIETTVIYAKVQLDEAEPAETFRFVPPSNAKLVEKFPGLPGAPAERSADFLGKPAPELQLRSADGKTVKLSSFRGQPVFLDFWATWCGPCVFLLKDLKELHAQTEPKGLAWIGIDSDEESEASSAFISKEAIRWPNYHDADGRLGKTFERNAIPLGVLIDAQGTVTFYQSGYEISDLKRAIAKLGPEFSFLTEPVTAAK